MTGTPNGDAPNVLNTSYAFTADVEIPEGGAEGMIVTHGGRFAGYGFYLLKGKPVFVHNLCDFARFRWEGKEALAPGKHTVAFDFTYDGPGLGKGGTGVLKVDGKEVANHKVPHTTPFVFQWDETFDVGSDTGTPVDDNDYQVPFKFTGKLHRLTVELNALSRFNQMRGSVESGSVTGFVQNAGDHGASGAFAVCPCNVNEVSAAFRIA